MTIGTLKGAQRSVVFEASSEKFQTFENLEHKSSVSYAEHKRHMKKPLLEMTGLDADTVSFEMTLSVLLGGSPRKTHEKLYKMMKNGELLTFVVGTTAIGTKWVITDVSKAFKTMYKDGRLISCEVSVSLKEYN